MSQHYPYLGIVVSNKSFFKIVTEDLVHNDRLVNFSTTYHITLYSTISQLVV